MPTVALIAPSSQDLEDGRANPLTAAHNIATNRFSLLLHPDRADWCEVEDWMAAEGWDPGYGDAQAVTALDKRALVIGLLDDQAVSAISLLRVSAEYAVVGNHIVHPDYRGRGFGLATWRAVLPQAAGHVIGLDAAPERVDTYRSAGFTTLGGVTCAYQGPITRFGGQPAADPRIGVLEPGDQDAVVALDAASAPFERPAFLAAWFATSGTRTLVYRDGSRVRGFGSIRPTRAGYRIGPLIAEAPDVALALFDALTAPHEGDLVRLSCPETNRSGADLARSRGLTRAGSTVRMYSHPVRPTALVRCFATASPAYG